MAGIRNRSVYPKSTRDESRFPCSGFRAIPQPTSYTTSGLTFFRRFQRFPETPVSNLEEHQFQHSKSRKAPCTPYRLEFRADSLALTEEESQLSTSTSRGARKKFRLTCCGLNAGSPFMSQDEGMSESPVEHLENFLFPASTGQES